MIRQTNRTCVILIISITILWILPSKLNVFMIPSIKMKVIKFSEENKVTKSPDKQNRYLTSDKSRPSYCLPVPPEGSIFHNENFHDCSLPYVLMSDGGLLGNQISQYCALFILRDTFGIRVTITDKAYKFLSKIFQHIDIPINSKKCFAPGVKRIFYGELYRELIINAKTMGLFNNDSNTRMNILKQSYYVFNAAAPRDFMWLYRDKLRKELVFKSSIINAAKAKINRTIHALGTSRENLTLVTVHVRRTDYKIWLRNTYKTDLVEELYFQRAFSFYRNKFTNPLFMVTSDDQQWCRQHLHGHNVIISASTNWAVDHALLSLGDHHIITYGTYGFTSALLGNGIVVHPVNYSKQFIWQTEILNCVPEFNTLQPINAGK